MLSVADARAAILAGAAARVDVSSLPLMAAQSRILAADVFAPCHVPPCDNSAMDGYAVRVSDFSAHTVLPIAAIAYAGSAPTLLQPGTAQRIFTGAPVPVGADAVVMQEDVLREGDGIALKPGEILAVGDNIRRAGEDIGAGALLFQRGHSLRAQDIGLLASVGIAALSVFDRLRVGLLCTGDELREPGEVLLPGQIYNSNRFLLASLLRDLGCEVVDAGVVTDTLEATQQALQTLAADCDVVISTGGVSVGDADFVKTAVQALGKLDVWKIAIKPGKPLAFGSVCDKVFFGLPGNPVSAFVTFLLFVRPYLQLAQGGTVCDLRSLRVQAGFGWPRAGKREEYLRVQLQHGADGELRAIAYPHQGSGVLSSVCWAHALLRVPVGEVFSIGDQVECLLLTQ